MSSLQGLVSGYLISGMYAETAVMLGHELFDEPVVFSAFSLQHARDLGAEDLFEFFRFCLGEAIEGPVRSKKPIASSFFLLTLKA